MLLFFRIKWCNEKKEESEGYFSYHSSESIQIHQRLFAGCQIDTDTDRPEGYRPVEISFLGLPRDQHAHHAFTVPDYRTRTRTTVS
jgi:hypothetical protein